MKLGCCLYRPTNFLQMKYYNEIILFSNDQGIICSVRVAGHLMGPETDKICPDRAGRPRLLTPGSGWEGCSHASARNSLSPRRGRAR